MRCARHLHRRIRKPRCRPVRLFRRLVQHRHTATAHRSAVYVDRRRTIDDDIHLRIDNDASRNRDAVSNEHAGSNPAIYDDHSTAGYDGNCSANASKRLDTIRDGHGYSEPNGNTKSNRDERRRDRDAGFEPNSDGDAEPNRFGDIQSHGNRYTVPNRQPDVRAVAEPDGDRGIYRDRH